MVNLYISPTHFFRIPPKNRCNLKYNEEKGVDEGECVVVGNCQRDKDCVIASYPHCDKYNGESTGICMKLECRKHQDCKVCNLVHPSISFNMPFTGICKIY